MLLVGLLLIIIIGVIAYRLRAAGSSARKLWRDEKGNLVAIGDRQGVTPGRLSGRGNALSAPLQLDAGNYRIDYQFDALTRVALVDASGDETLFIRGGTGTEALAIAESGRYRFLFEPADESASWLLTYRPLGTLPHANA
jgi:hypothetical protein